MSYIIGGIDMGNLPNYLLFFSNGSVDANWQGASKGFVGDVAVDGIQASERTSGFVPYAGTIYTNDATLGAWQAIVNANPGQASASYNQVARISGLEANLVSAFQQINALPVTPGFESVAATDLNGLNTQNGINEIFVINVTSGFQVSSQINITGDAGDVYILRWDEDANPANGYQGQVKFQSGGAIVPHGGLKPTNFINVAGDINSSGGGSNPPPPYPQGPRYNDGQGALITGGADFSGGGFFTGYWLTTGAPDIFDPTTGLWYGNTAPLSNGIFVGGWYSITDKFSMTSGTSGVYVSPNPATIPPAISVQKDVSPDNGATWYPADTAPGPNVVAPTNPQFRFTVTNTGNVTLTNVTVTDDVYGPIGTLPSLDPGASFTWIVTKPWLLGQQVNTATATGTAPDGTTVTASNPAYWVGVPAPAPAIDVQKDVSPDNGVTWYPADTAPGPNVVQGTTPQFRFTVTNTGNVTLAPVVVTDDVYGPIGTLPSLAPGASFTWIISRPWLPGQQVNTATATGTAPDGTTVTSTNPAYWVGVEAPAPAIDVLKDVSPDNGGTWDPADTPPGPNVLQGTNPQFRFTVTNTGNVTLSNVVVTDDVYGPIGTLPSLAPGNSFTWIVTEPWLLGQQVNTATATGDYAGQTVTASNPAYWVGVEVPGQPAIDVQKDVSPDNGTTWYPADTAPGPDVVAPTNPQFRFTVTNTGGVTLSPVDVTDDVYGPIGSLPSLAPGASFTWIITRPWLPGQQVNTATATGTAPDGTTVTATNPAYWVGVEAPAPAIDVLKDVSPDNGVTWDPADTPPGPNVIQGTNPQFRFTVTNIGNVTLSNVVVTDDVYGPIGTLPSLAPTASFTFIITKPWQLGQQVNTATATGDYAGQTVTASNPAYWVGVAAQVPAIDVQKDVSPDNGTTWYPADTAPGPDVVQGTNPLFRFIVTNTGNVTLSPVVVTDDVYGPIGTLPSLVPGASFGWVIIRPWLPGQQVNRATATGTAPDGTTVSSTNPAYWVGVLPPAPAIDVLKDVSPDNGMTWFPADTAPGPNVVSPINPQFRFTITNTGNVMLTPVVVTDDVYGPIGIVPSLAPEASAQFIIVAPWAGGQQVNTATATGTAPDGSTVTATNPAYWVGVIGPIPSITIEKYVSIDNGATWLEADTPPGPLLPEGIVPQYKIVVTNNGNVDLTNITVTDTEFGTIGTLATLAVGASYTWFKP